MFVDTYHASSTEAVWGEDSIGLRSRHVSESHRVTTKIRNGFYAEYAASDDDRPHLPLSVPVIHA